MYGALDLADNFELAGWAVQADRRTPDRVVIEINGHQVAELTCSCFRRDLLESGFGDGYCGFRFVYPEALALDGPVRVVVRSVSTGKPLHSGERLIPHILAASKGLRAVAYAASATAVEKEGEDIIVRGRTLAPTNAMLGVVPAQELSGVVVKNIQFVPVHSADILDVGFGDFRLTIGFNHDQQIEEKVLVFNVVNRTTASGDRQAEKRAINPVCHICIPVTTTWMTVPDEENIRRTSGPVSANYFITTGVSLAFAIHSILDEFFDRDQAIRILDWGIGCGRVSVPLKRLLRQNAHVIGLDVDTVNIAWCAENLHDIETSVCDFYPPLQLEDASLDVIFGVSVMTHLTEAAQFVWLKELRRILKPGGICILTTHGEHALVALRIRHSMVFKDLMETGISDRTLDRNLGDNLDLKGYYRATFQLRDQVEKSWSKHLPIMSYFPAGNGVIQDVIVLRKESQ